MRRHRSTFERDEAPKMDGDGAFMGVDMVLAPDKLPPGMVAYSLNRVFEDGESRVRKGCTSMAWSNPMGCNFDGGAGDDEVTFEPIRMAWDATAIYYEGDEVRKVAGGVVTYYRATEDPTIGADPASLEVWEVATNLKDTALFTDFLEIPIFGAGRYSDPITGYEWMVLLLEDRALLCRQFQFPQEHPYPDDITLTGQDCTLTQAYEKLILWRGETGTAYNAAAEPLTFTFAAGWRRMSIDSPTPEGEQVETARLPNAAQAVYFSNRLWVPFNRDAVAVSDILSLRWDPLLQEESINFGEADALTALYPYDRTTLLAFKGRQVYALLNAIGDLSTMTLAVISREIGCIAPQSIASWGQFVAFLGDSGIWTLEQIDANRVQVAEHPLSYPIQTIVDGINWERAHIAQSIVHDGKLYVAVPYGTSQDNDTVLVYNINRGVWEGHWTSANWKIRRWVKGHYFGQTRLYFWHDDGFLVLMEHGDEDEIGPNTHEIASQMITRGYNAESPHRLRGLRLFLNLRARRATYSAEALVDKVGRVGRLITNEEPSSTRRRLIGQKPWDITNAGDDFNDPGREDYTARIPGPAGLFFLGTGVQLDLLQEWEQIFPLNREGRYVQANITSSKGQLAIQAVRIEARDGRRDSREKGY